MKKAFLFVLTISSVLLCSCGIDILNKVKGNGYIKTEQRNLPPFNGVKSTMGFEVVIEEGNSSEITIEADENLLEIISTEVENNVLIIKSDQVISNASSRKITIYNNNLNFIKATSGSNIKTNCTMKSKEISVEATSGGYVNTVIDATSVETRTTSGAEIKIVGTTTNHASSANSGSSINAYRLLSKNALVKASSGAEIDVFASIKLEAKASSGASINFKGNPKKVNVKSSSGGSIKDKD